MRRVANADANAWWRSLGLSWRILRNPKQKVIPIPYYLQKYQGLRAITLSLNCKAVSVASKAVRTDVILQTRHEIFNGSELNRDGKVNFLISGDASLPAASVESAGRGNTELLISVIYLATSQTHPRLAPKYPANPFPQSRTLETSHLPLGRSSRLTLIQLKTSDRAKQRRIDHENFNWCYRYEGG